MQKFLEISKKFSTSFDICTCFDCLYSTEISRSFQKIFVIVIVSISYMIWLTNIDKSSKETVKSFFGAKPSYEFNQMMVSL